MFPLNFHFYQSIQNRREQVIVKLDGALIDSLEMRLAVPVGGKIKSEAISSNQR
jgi:hypothetical protein